MPEDLGNESGGTMFTSRSGRRRFGVHPAAGVGILVVAVAVAVGVWLWLRPDGAPEPVPAPAADSTAGAEEEEPFVLPALGASDAVVRRLAARVSAHPQLVSWLFTDDLIRRFVTAVVDISRGSSPLPALEVLIPEAPFTVQESAGRLFMDPRSQERYDLLADVFTSVDALAAAEMYGRLLPLFQEAYQELGIPEQTFEETLNRAIENLLAVEVPERRLELREAIGRYTYMDEEIESLTPAEKHLFRMGPENARRIQEKLREIGEVLQLAPEAGEVEEGTSGP